MKRKGLSVVENWFEFLGSYGHCRVWVYCINKNTGHWLFHLLSQPWNLILWCFLKILGFFLGFLISSSEITQQIYCPTLLLLFITGPITRGQGCSLFSYVERHTQLNPKYSVDMLGTDKASNAKLFTFYLCCCMGKIHRLSWSIDLRCMLLSLPVLYK